MRSRLLCILLLGLVSCSTFASKEYKQAISQAKEVKDIEISESSNNLDQLKNANSELQSAINSLEQLPDNKSDQKVTETLSELKQKQQQIENKIKTLEREQKEKKLQEEREKKVKSLEPYICKGVVAHANNTIPKIINVDSTDNYINLSYTRAEDDSEWSYVCDITNAQFKPEINGKVNFASDIESLNNNKENEFSYTITEKEEETLITITGINSDSSSEPTTFRKTELK